MRSAWQHLSRIARASRAIPTTDLYFANACRPWLSPGPGRSAPLVRRVGANSFVAGDHAIICRMDAPGVVRTLLSHPGLRITYVIDDDIDAAAYDDTLPADYRARLTKLREGQYKAIIEKARTIVVPTPHLVDKYAATHETAEIDPCWSSPLADDTHFDALERGGPMRIGYLGSVTHGADRAFVGAVLKEVLATHPEVRVTMISRGRLDAPLDAHPRLELRRPMPWSLHRVRHRRLRQHLALYPMLDTPFNKGRSFNKVIEHAVLGAVGMYSADWIFADRVRDGETGFLVPNDVDRWIEAIDAAIRQPERLRAMHAKARVAASALNDPENQRRFWLSHLGLQPERIVPAVSVGG